MKEFLKFIIPVLLVIIGFVYFFNSITDKRNLDGSIDLDNSRLYEVIIIDSCEYIIAPYSICHKGNCKFCLSRYVH